jgi:hypothetical protein
MPAQPLILRNLALLLFALMVTMIAGASSAQQQQVVSADASPPQNTIVLDAIGNLLTSTRFKQPGSSGAPLDEHNSEGPEFILTEATTLTEIGAYVESCYGKYRGKYLEECDPLPSIVVNIHPQLNGKPDVATVIASYTLSNDNDRTLISYESVKLKLSLQPGTYYAIFNNPSSSGILLAGASHPHLYRCRSINMAYIRKDPDVIFTSRQYLAVRLLKETD